MPALEIDDGEAAMPEPDARLDMEPIAIRSAMGERAGDAAQQRGIDPIPAWGPKNPRYPTHRLRLSSARRGRYSGILLNGEFNIAAAGREHTAAFNLHQKHHKMIKKLLLLDSTDGIKLVK
jgi:hypothetical protein